jgi:hypothetical protein
VNTCSSDGGFNVTQAADKFSACSPVFQVDTQSGAENAAFNAELPGHQIRLRPGLPIRHDTTVRRPVRPRRHILRHHTHPRAIARPRMPAGTVPT